MIKDYLIDVEGQLKILWFGIKGKSVRLSVNKMNDLKDVEIMFMKDISRWIRWLYYVKWTTISIRRNVQGHLRHYG